MTIGAEKSQNGLLKSNKASHPYQSPNACLSEDPDPKNCPGPDRGRAWLIVFACTWVAFVSFGLSRSSGILFVAFVNNFNASREHASWPSSLFYTAYCLSSPLIAPLCNHVSLRLISSVGSIVAALGVGLSYFAEDIISLTLLFGLLQGIGAALLNIPATLVVNIYFERHRTTANGILQAGNSIGAFVFPPVIQAILTSHGLKNSFLCMSTILFSSLLPVMLFVLPEWGQKGKRHKRSASDSPEKELLNKTNNVITGVNVPSKEKDLKLLEEMCTSKSRIFNENDPLLENSDGYLVSQPHYVSFPRFSASCENSVEITHGDRKSTIIIIWTVLNHPMFWLLLALHFIIGMCYPIYLQIFVDYSAEWRISATTASFIISIMSVVELVGRLGTGWISDCGFVTKRTLVSSACAFGGLCFCLIPFNDIVPVFVTLSLSICFVEGILSPLLTAAKMEYFGQEKFIITFALTLSLNGCLSLLRPLLIGYFRDSVGSYDGLSISLGVVFFMTAFIWLFEPLIIRRVRSAEEKQNQISVSYGSTS